MCCDDDNGETRVSEKGDEKPLGCLSALNFQKISSCDNLIVFEVEPPWLTALYFCSISSEFLALMKKVTKSPLVMDVLNIPGVQKSLERLADLLGKIQKALGEYLERERASFPRYVCAAALDRGWPPLLANHLPYLVIRVTKNIHNVYPFIEVVIFLQVLFCW